MSHLHGFIIDRFNKNKSLTEAAKKGEPDEKTEMKPSKDAEAHEPKSEADDKPKSDPPGDKEGGEKKEKTKEYQTHHPRKIEACIRSQWKELGYAKKFDTMANDFGIEVENYLKRKMKMSGDDIEKVLYDVDEKCSNADIPIAIVKHLVH